MHTDLVSEYHIHWIVSALVVYGLGTLPLLWVIVVAVSRIQVNRRTARAADASYDPRASLRPGPAVVAGEVVKEKSGGPAVRVEIDQLGTEHRQKNSYSHTWTETARRVTTGPFSLKLPDGQLLRVDPGERVFLIDKLDQTTRHDTRRRTIAAELTGGEPVHAVGYISEEIDPRSAFGGYRESAGRKPVLKPPPGDKLLIASERLGARYDARARFHLRWVIYSLIGLGFFHGVVCLGYHLRTLYGQDVEARVSGTRHWVTRGNKSTTHHYQVCAERTDNGDRLCEKVASRSFGKVQWGDRIVLIVVPGWPSVTQAGSVPTVNLLWSLMTIVVLGLMAIIYPASRRMSRPWYQQPKVVQTGSGRL